MASTARLAALLNKEDVMELRKRALGLSLGAVWGLSVFAATIWASARGHGEILVSLRSYYIGYSVSYLGAFVGLIYGLVHGFVAGALIAWFYDVFSKALYKTQGSVG
jgi:hypothetical protein